MNLKQGQRGSALIVSVTLTVLMVGVAGAFLAESVFRAKAQGRAIESDEVQVMCDAALERARLALLHARNRDGGAWNPILENCQSGLSVWTPEAIAQDYKRRQKASEFSSHSAAVDAQLPTLSGAGSAMVQPLFSGEGATPPVFNANVPFRKGAYFVQVRNNVDIMGNGVDDNGDGDPWDPDTAAEVNAGLSSPVVDGDKQVYIVVTATFPDGTQRQMESLVRYPTGRWMPPAALLTGGTLSMSGAFSILGTSGVVHSNEDVVGQGSANAQVSVAVNAAGSTGGFTMKTAPPQGINDSKSSPPIGAVPIPTVNPAEFRHDASLTPAMVVLDRFGNITDAAGGPPPAGSYPFTFSKGEWSISGAGTVTPAIYYVEGDFRMTGQGNSDPYTMTIIATGSVSLGGNSKFQAYVDPVTGKSTNILALAGGDLSLTGTGNSTTLQYQGVSLAHEQVFVKGNFKMEGAVVGENAADHSDTVSSSSAVEDTLMGNATIVYNGMTTFVRNPQQAVSVVNVRRVK
jgi:hypothetical protein